MVRIFCCRSCSPLYVVRHLRFRVFAILLGIVSLTSLALVFRRSMSFNTAYKLGSPLLPMEIKDVLVKANVRNSSNEVKDLNAIKTNVAKSSAACRLHVLDPFHSSVIHFMQDLGKLSCGGVSYSSFENNVLRVEGEGVVSAQYRKIDRPPGKDFGVVLSDPVVVQNTSEKKGKLLIKPLRCYVAQYLVKVEVSQASVQCVMLLRGIKLKIQDRS